MVATQQTINCVAEILWKIWRIAKPNLNCNLQPVTCLALIHKTIKHQTPDFLYQKVTSGSDHPRTRLSLAVASTAATTAAGAPGPPSIDSCELGLTRKSWCWTSVYLYKQLLVDLCSEQKTQTFKTRLKHWVSLHVEIWLVIIYSTLTLQLWKKFAHLYDL